MTSLTKKPTYHVGEFDYDELNESHFGTLLAENSCVVDELKTAIRILSQKAANEVWELTFGDANNKAAIATGNWSSSLSWAATGDWLPHYNAAESKPVENQLRQLIEWRDDQMVLFIKGPHDCVFTNWQSFVQNWLTFFEYDDDGPFIIPIDRNAVVRICPNGTYLKGTTATD